MPYGAMAVDYPDAFKNQAQIRSELVPLVTGSAFSSHPNNSTYFHPFVFDDPFYMNYLYVYKSMNAGPPAASSLASTGTNSYVYQHGLSIFQRQDYSNNSTNLTCIKTASGGFTAQLVFSSTSQVLNFSWATDATGGTSSMQFTSNNANYSNFLTGPKIMAIPVGYVVQPGEYFFAHAHSYTTGTAGANSNVTLCSVSNLHVAPQIFTGYRALAYSTSHSSAAVMGFGLGPASAVTTNATMAGSVISGQTANLWVQQASVI